MPKNSSARRRRRTRRIMAEEGVKKHTTALRRGDERTKQAHAIEQAERDSFLRPRKIEIDGVQRYIRREGAAQLPQDGMDDPTGKDVVAAADVLLPQLHALLPTRLRPITVTGTDGKPHRVMPCEPEHREQFRDTVYTVLREVKRVREDADIAWVEWSTVAVAFHQIHYPLRGLLRIIDGPLCDRIEAAVDAAEVLSTTAEAVHSRGCLLGAGENRSRRMYGYSPCEGSDVRVRAWIYDDDIIVTDPGCLRHAAEEIVHWDSYVETGESAVEIMGGTDRELDMIYNLATDIRREHQQIRQDQDAQRAGSYSRPSPPWMSRQDQ